VKFGLDEDSIILIQNIFINYQQIEEVVIYGSRAKGNYKKGSDIDLTFTGDNIRVSLLNRIGLDLDDLLLPYTFDLSIYQQIENTSLIDHIKRIGKQFYTKLK
jgi:predicted nucleotidyltransferase